ncbi:GntR family transcriptional regulator [Actinomadura terrae]|uniref:GntR family transcriptional regulator n=1 Tax=Actinomadura terrae TaxID=604353 RepID=UPI001FA6C24B|nr:GntR family transcriptional regulator [Actinomadura terrae]
MRIATIDPTGPLPKYMQLRSILIQVIEDGGLAAGAPLPSERELCRTYRLSRMTVRQTLELLVAEGRLRRRPGKGTFVASAPERALERTAERTPAHPVCLADGLRAGGLRLGFADLGERTVDAGARLAHALATEPGTAVHLLTRLVLADGEPVAVERSCVLAALAPGLATRGRAESPLPRLLAGAFGLVFDPAEQTIGAVPAGAADARRLRIPPGSPALLLRERGTRQGVRGAVITMLVRADRFCVRPARRPGEPVALVPGVEPLPPEIEAEGLVDGAAVTWGW